MTTVTDPTTLPVFLTVAEAAALLRLGQRQTYERCREGTLPAVKVGGTWRIPRDTLLRRLGLDGEG